MSGKKSVPEKCASGAEKNVRAGCVLHSSARGTIVPEVTETEMLSLTIRPHVSMGDGRLARQTVFIKQSTVKRDGLPRRLLGGNSSHRRVSGKNARVAATRGEIIAASEKAQEANEPYRFEEMCTTTMIAAVSASALFVRPSETARPANSSRERKIRAERETRDASSPSRAVFPLDSEKIFYSQTRPSHARLERVASTSCD